jgi:tubulin polyglutamylase TTLL6/13
MCFEILGFDIIVDSNLKPYILEVNHAPSLNSDTQYDIKNKTDLLTGVFNLIGVSVEN